MPVSVIYPVGRSPALSLTYPISCIHFLTDTLTVNFRKKKKHQVIQPSSSRWKSGTSPVVLLFQIPTRVLLNLDSTDFEHVRSVALGLLVLVCWIVLLPIISIHVNLRWPACSAITQLCVGCSSSPWPVSLSSPSCCTVVREDAHWPAAAPLS